MTTTRLGLSLNWSLGFYHDGLDPSHSGGGGFYDKRGTAEQWIKEGINGQGPCQNSGPFVNGRIIGAEAEMKVMTAVGLTLFAFVGAHYAPCVRPLSSVAAQGRDPVQAPIFEVDPFWPKPLPNHWVMGSTVGLSVDSQDHVWVIHRPQTVEANFKGADLTPPIGACCSVAPPVLEFDQAGNLVGHWGGPGQGYEWPESNHGITVDSQENVWIGSEGSTDTEILKFDRRGKFLLQVGHQGKHNGSNDPENFWRPTKIYEDAAANEVYVADGYNNRRVVVLDRDTGKYKRHWGAYGNKPDDGKVDAYDPAGPPSKQFHTVHCVAVSKDGFVYVCDRGNDRVQVFRTDGTFVKEAFFDKKTLRSGSVWDMTFSRDPQQTYIYMANGVDEKINILLRSSLEVLTSFGDGGRQPGEFFGVHNLDTDSKGNLYTAETYTGARVQRFLNKGVGPVNKGVAPVTKAEQGVPWPQTN
jgi:DNA-binding beta-propeller fold protein YncE